MKIGINCQQYFEKATGPGIYLRKLLEYLLPISKEHKVTLYFQKYPEEDFSRFENLKIKVLEIGFSWTHSAITKELFQNPVDVFFTPYHTLPIIKNPKVKCMSMIHGLEHATNQQFANKPLNKIIHPLVLGNLVRQSDKIIVPSQTTKTRIEKSYLGILAQKKVTVIYEGVDEYFYKRTKDESAMILEKYGIKNPYFLFISTIQPRKNIPKMVEAFSLFAKNKNVELLIAGKKGWQFEESLASPKKFNVEDKVKFLGKIEDEERPLLLSQALAYVSFSIEEGFGLPVLEAMRCETPILVSDIPAYKEVSSNFGIFCKPTSVQEMAKGFETVFSENYPRDFLQKALIKSKEFSWEKTARETLKTMTYVGTRL